MNKSKERKVSVEEFVCQLETFMDNMEIVNYTITENFKKNPNNTYRVINITTEELKINGEQLIIFYDLDGILDEGYKVLKIVATRSIKSISNKWVDETNTCEYLLEFQDGTILVQVFMK